MTFAVSHDHVGLSVRQEDLAATIDWYTGALGLSVERHFDSHGLTFVFLAGGDVRIEVVAGGAASGQAVPENVFASLDPARLHHFCVAVDDLDAAIAVLAGRGVRLIGGPMDVREIGQRIAFIADNLGNVIELTEPSRA